jgi:hypothetical protein
MSALPVEQLNMESSTIKKDLSPEKKEIKALKEQLKEFLEISSLDKESSMYYEKLHYFEEKIAKQFLQKLGEN